MWNPKSEAHRNREKIGAARVGGRGDAGAKIQTFSDKISKLWGANVKQVTIVDNTGLHT